MGKLISNLRHPDWVVAASAAGELAGIGEEAKDAIPIMIQLLSSPDADVRGHMARALGYFGPVASSAVDDLKRLLGDKANCWHEDVADSFPVRFRAAFAIGNVNPTNEEVLPVVCEALTRENHHARKEAHGFVRRYGKDNDLFVPILKKEVEHRDPLRQMFARITLAIIDPGYDDQDETVRRLAETWRSDSSVHQSPNSRNA